MLAVTDVTVVILAGGLGTRLKSALPDRPKVLAPVNGRPFLAYILRHLDRAGFTRAVMCVGHLGGLVQDAMGERFGGIHIAYSEEAAPLGTAGALRLASDKIQSECVLVMNGDSFIDVNFHFFLKWYDTHSPFIGMLLSWQSDTNRYGRVGIDDCGRIMSFEEKCREAGSGFINAGVYLFKKHLLTTIPQGRAFSLEREWLPQFMNGTMQGFKCTGSFIDIGTPESYAAVASFFRDERFND